MPYKSITETFFFMCVVWALQLVRDVPETKKKWMKNLLIHSSSILRAVISCSYFQFCEVFVITFRTEVFGEGVRGTLEHGNLATNH
jgi:hypothetical protein